MCSQTKVLYIAGWGRSGSTILDNVLGQIDGFFSAGELRYIWDRGLVENRLCGCGVPFRECEVWTGVLHNAFGGLDKVKEHEMVRLRGKLHTRHLLFTSLPGGQQRLLSHLEEYPETMERLYHAIHSVTGNKVIVDSSKSPSHLWMLGMMPTIDLYVIHLVRDPRGVAYSWLRRKLQLDMGRRAFIQSLSPATSSMTWDVWNAVIGTLAKKPLHRCLRVHYEDFIDKPLRTMECILGLVRETEADLSFISKGSVRLDTNHTVSGNPSRFVTGAVELRLDREWEESMRRRDKAVVTILTWPLLLRYGYLRKRRPY
jgi:hypothetical protein